MIELLSIISKDERVQGLFIGGSKLADQFSDIDYFIVRTETRSRTKDFL
ncbi:MAG: hypothetical protein ACTSP3_06305 [Candidatus Heimdallarchaeaceae archaeon]